MKRTVDRGPLDKWIEAHYPDAITQLAGVSKVPANTIHKIRSAGYVPKDAKKRKALAGALGVSEDTLFPLVGNEAS